MIRLARPLALLVLLGCAARSVPAPTMDAHHPLAAPGVAARLREAAERVDARDFAGAEALLRPLTPDPMARERAALQVLGVAMEQEAAGDAEGATETLRALARDHGGTRAGQHAAMLLAEREVVGHDAGALDGVRWLQGEARLGDGTTLLLFFETWCPHCRRELPSTQARAEAFAAEGLAVVGLTGMSRGTTEEEVRALLDEAGVTFPVGVEDGELSERFRISGIPAAAVVRDGRIAWRGHPAALDEDTLRALLSGAR